MQEQLADPFASQKNPSSPFDDDAPPTVMMNDPRVTNPTGWAGSSQVDQWRPQTPVYQQPQFGMQNYRSSADQTLPIVSLVLGVLSAVFVCCYGGIWLGLPAIVLGFMGLRNADSDPSRYGGRGLAIAGLVIGIITLIASVGFLILGVLGNIT